MGVLKKIQIPYKWELLVLLWFAFFLNLADRQIFNIVLPSIRDDLNLSDANMGLISTIFLIIYGLLVPLGGILGDRINKKYILIFSLLIWSTATVGTGLLLMGGFIVGAASPYILGVLKPAFGLANGLAFLSVGFNQF